MRTIVEEYIKKMDLPEDVGAEMDGILDRYQEEDQGKHSFRIQTLEIRKLAHLPDMVLDFTKGKIMQIEGKNKIGKTLLAESIFMLLFNKGREMIGNVLEKDTEIDLKFQVDGKELDLEVRKAKYRIKRGDQIICGGIKDAKDFMARNGMGDNFVQLAFLGDSSSYLTSKEPRDFKAMFMEIFNASSSDKIKADLRTALNETEEAIAKQNGRLNALREIQSEEREEELKIQIKELKALVKEKKAVQDELLSLETTAPEKLNKLTQQIAQAKEEKMSLQDEQKKTVKARGYRTAFGDLEQHSKNLEKIQGKIQKKMDERSALINDREDRRAEERSAKEALDAMEALGSECQVCGSEISQAKKELRAKNLKKRVQDAVESQEKAQAKVAAIDTEIMQLKQEESAVARDQGTAKARIQELESLGIKNQDDLGKYLQDGLEDQIQTEMKAAESKAEKALEELEKYKKMDNSSRRADLEKKIHEIDQANSRIEVAKEKIKRIQENQDKITTETETMKTLVKQKLRKEKTLRIFDKNESDSFPLFQLIQNKEQVESRVNTMLAKMPDMDLKIEINGKFEIIARPTGPRPGILSRSELKTLNLCLHTVMLQMMAGEENQAPFIVLDDFDAFFDTENKARVEKIIKEIAGTFSHVITTTATEGTLNVQFKKPSNSK